MAKSGASGIMDTVGDWYAKLPNLPANIREVIVKITPWIALIFGILGLLAGIAGLGVLTFLAPLVALGGGFQSAGTGIIASVLLIASAGLLLAAFPGTNKRKSQGWDFLFWSEVVSLVSSVLAISLTGVLGNLIGLYILYQIRTYYK